MMKNVLFKLCTIKDQCSPAFRKSSKFQNLWHYQTLLDAAQNP